MSAWRAPRRVRDIICRDEWVGIPGGAGQWRVAHWHMFGGKRGWPQAGTGVWQGVAGSQLDWGMGKAVTGWWAFMGTRVRVVLTCQSGLTGLTSEEKKILNLFIQFPINSEVE
jgi:hypothetical protein